VQPIIPQIITSRERLLSKSFSISDLDSPGNDEDSSRSERSNSTMARRVRKKQTSLSSKSKMKASRHASAARPHIHLPVEIIIKIQSYSLFQANEQCRQHLLSVFCLISKQWYSATISRLYERPLLVNRNFYRFARTLCPLNNSYQPRIGDHFVKHLDMRCLTYEITKRQTARLLKQTGYSLESFVASTASFG